MQFTTKIPIQKSNFPIDYDSKIMLLGSCFAENMGEKFEYFKFQTIVNPFGIIFNPVSLEKLIRRSIEKRKFTENDIFFHNDLWHCFEVHSELSNSDKDVFLENLNEILAVTRNQLESLSHCFITLGTSWIYRNVASKQIVANCHKVPQKEFSKELLSIAAIEESLSNILTLLPAINPNCSVVFTVSPVRHIKDGFVENTLSKAHLIAALQSILKSESGLLNAEYFPSYEIMMDELRDYRFYAEDLLHPNATAIAYIWERFVLRSVTVESLPIMEEVATIQKGLAHRPFHADSESHQKFLAQLQLKIVQLQAQFPAMTF